MTTTDELVGTAVGGKYQVVQRVARGGMSRVYLAVQEPLGRRVALKTLDPRTDDENEVRDFRERFLQEAATVARLRHPNTVTIDDYGVIAETGSLYMVMEWVEGRTLLQEIKEHGPLSPERAVRIAHEVVRSLQEAHEIGIVHRDVKSANVMLTTTAEGETVKVIDFGIAMGEHGATDGDWPFGTARYMSPEQAMGLPLDGRTDLYSLGVVLFEMLTGEPPFKSDSNLQTMLAQVRDPPPAVRTLCPNPLPDALVAALDRCLAKGPADRPESALALRRLLQGVLVELAGSPVRVTPDAAPSTVAAPAPDWNPLVVLSFVTTVMSIALACLGIVLVWIAAGRLWP